MTEENPIIIEDREELMYMLSEAASLEHMIMCQYLFAAFTLKRDVSEGVTEEQLEAIKRWERQISLVATQEMLHLTLVNNMLTAIGSIPFLGHPNFPQRANYYPPGVQLALLPFGRDALQHFLFLERPEGMDLQDAPEFEVLAIPRPNLNLDTDQIVPQDQEFATVGHLYRGIEQGFRHLVAKYGEKQIFVGPQRAQATQKHFAWPELIPVTDLASACQAIETIVEQGEGARGDWKEGHYGKFLQVAQEYRQMKEQNPDFEPARPAVGAFANPPGEVSEVTVISHPLTASVSELFNASYQALLQVLLRYFIHGTESDDELTILSNVAVDAMFLLIKPLGELLTRLPLGPEYPDKVAGPCFEVYHSGNILPHRYGAWTILHERLLELADYSDKLAGQEGAPKELTMISANARQLAGTLAGPLAAMSPNTH
ncbi:MAG TPA: ferritin-like domain-containing protein [Ktedonosporobacter sp.]|nr:ferritin-like domain-containing protein [Ktedonosporobacter sp.]